MNKASSNPKTNDKLNKITTPLQVHENLVMALVKCVIR
jgi:hypothetical protein